MAATTLKSLVLKTATVGSVKLPAPADRIGSGATAVNMPPANSLSQGQFFQPRLPVRERIGLRQEVAAMRYQPAPVAPTSSVGSVSGTSACRCLSALHADKRKSWPDHPWSLKADSRLGRDCQSPDRDEARTDRLVVEFTTTTRIVGSATTAARK
jgi:hypothetical protein